MSTSTSTDASALAIDDRTAALLFRDAHTAYAFTDQPANSSSPRGRLALMPAQGAGSTRPASIR